MSNNNSNNSSANSSDVFNKLNDIVAKAKKMGADDVHTSLVTSEGLSASVRLGKPQELQRSSSSEFYVTVYAGQKSGSGMANSLRPEHMEMALKQALSNAKGSTDDPYGGVADRSQIADTYPCPDIYDPTEPSEQKLFDAAKEAEAVALSHAGISNSEGAQAGWGRDTTTIVISNGFAGSYQRSGTSLYTSAMATRGEKTESAYDYDSAVYLSDLKSPSEIGDEAARKAVEKLGARKVNSGKATVIFDPAVSGSLIREFLKAIKGGAVITDQSFLKDMMDKKVFGDNISIIDDPLMPRGLGSHPFDGNGIKTQQRKFVENGVLKSWMLGLETARELGLQTTGHGGGGVNMYLSAGDLSPEELMADLKDGFYVTSLMGHGGNTLTGDYSLGASGLWIKDGKKDFAVSEVTIAGNLLDMFGNAIPANDLDRKKSSLAVPTLRVEGMMIGGK